MSSNYDNKLTDQVKRMRPLLAHIALGTCRVIEQVTGWYISAGSSTTKYLEHGTAFRLDSTGNARGALAVDMQSDRSLDTEVASGAASTISGGYDNTASGFLATVPGGFGNIAAEDYSIAMGFGAKTHTRKSMAHGAYRSSYGDSQGGRYIGGDSIGMGGAGAWHTIDLGENGGVEMPTDTVMTFNALVAGTTAGCTKSFGYRIEGVAENDGGTTSILGSTVTTLYEDDANFNCRANADDANDLLEIQVVDAGLSSDTVAWTVRIDTAEVTNPA